jgi:hypothetical protein
MLSTKHNCVHAHWYGLGVHHHLAIYTSPFESVISLVDFLGFFSGEGKGKGGKEKGRGGESPPERVLTPYSKPYFHNGSIVG